MKKIFVGFMAIFAILMTGCSEISTMTQKEPVVLTPKTVKKGEFTFVIPANFVLEENKSLIYEIKKQIRAYLVYTGKGSLDDLVTFFNEYLYKLGWNRESKLVGEEAILAYSRNDQLIVIRIRPKFQITQVEFMLTKK